MRRLHVIIAGLVVLAVPAVGIAGVAGSSHDLTGTGAKLCFACHIPHNALGEKLWAVDTGGGTTVSDLCETCHDGSVTTVGEMVFDPALQNHKPVGGDCSGDTGFCHDVHNQNPNGTGRFLTVTRTNNSYCETCHDATQFAGAEGLGDHTAGITHFTNGTTFTCNQCHTVHGATPQTTNPVGLTNPILLADNQTGSFYGDFCISCHSGTAPAEGVAGSGQVAASDVFDYSQARNPGLTVKHPTGTTGATPISGCDHCHDVHDPTGTAHGYLLTADNTNSAFCVSCHSQAGAPSVGGNSHYLGVPTDVNMNSGLTPALPWANQIDEDGTAGADWAGATANYMACETCHSVHRQGFATTPAYFLRDDNSNNQICQACHKTN